MAAQNLRKRSAQKKVADDHGLSHHTNPIKHVSVLDGKSRNQLHLVRKFFHALTGSGFAALYEYYLDKQQTMMVYGTMFALLVLAEGLRMKFPNTVNRLALHLTQSLMRTYEKDHASGMVYFVAGILFCVGILPKNAAVLSILYLSIGDPVASACGIKYGSRGPKFSNGKSLIGYIGGLLACAFTTYIYFIRTCEHSITLVIVSIIGGFAGATMEVLCSRKIGPDGLGGPIDVDDNLAVPIGSGCFFYMMLSLFFPNFCEAASTSG